MADWVVVVCAVGVNTQASKDARDRLPKVAPVERPRGGAALEKIEGFTTKAAAEAAAAALLYLGANVQVRGFVVERK